MFYIDGRLLPWVTVQEPPRHLMTDLVQNQKSASLFMPEGAGNLRQILNDVDTNIPEDIRA